jgi:hypothetical protein
VNRKVKGEIKMFNTMCAIALVLTLSALGALVLYIAVEYVEAKAIAKYGK